MKFLAKFKSVLFVVVLAMLTAGRLFVACGDKNNNDTTTEQVCNVDNPLTDLPWLKSLINEWLQDNLYSTHKRIYQCTYNTDKTGFLIENCVNCPDAGYSLCSCSGEIICYGGGIAGFSCDEFNICNEILIWEINKK